MPSPFDAIDAAMQAVIDASFGEGVRVIPMVGDGNYSSAADQSRPAATVRATVGRAPGVKPTDFNNSNRNGAPLATAPLEIWIDRAAYDALGYELRRGDRIEITEDGTPPPSYAIAAAHKGDNGDVQIILAG